jgi:hypothetical protein
MVELISASSENLIQGTHVSWSDQKQVDRQGQEPVSSRDKIQCQAYTLHSKIVANKDDGKARVIRVSELLGFLGLLGFIGLLG